MEININLFHEKPMFSFRCKKEDKKRIKKLAKEVGMATDEFILDATRRYRAMMDGIPFGEFRKYINKRTPIKIYQFGGNNIPKGFIDDIDHEYDVYPILDIRGTAFDEYDGPDLNGLAGIYIELDQLTLERRRNLRK